MKNLENYNVQKMSNVEIIEVVGGNKVPWTPWALLAYVLEEVYEGATRDCTSTCNHL